MMSKSRLCIGLDPRESQPNVGDLIQLVDDTFEFAIAYKPNIQFWHGTSKTNIKRLNHHIHSYELPSIADLKLSDIGSTNEMALKKMKEMDFDYVTVSPFPGNLRQTSEIAKDIGIGIIALVIMSNPEAKWMVETGIYKRWAIEADQFADGIVVGTTNHVTKEILVDIAKMCPKPFILAPGIGSQGGAVQLAKSLFSDRILFNVSRAISLSENPHSTAKEYYDLCI